MPMIYELLEGDHARVRDLLRSMREDADLSDEGALGLLSVVRKELEIHMAFEEEVFYPAARDATELNDEIDTGLEEHDEVRSLLDELSQLEPASDDWAETLEDLATVLEDHVEDEEGELFAATRETLDKSVAAILGDDYAQMRQKAFAGN